MISEIDVKDWEMLTEPLPVSQLKPYDLFSVHGSTDVFKYTGHIGKAVIAILQQNESRELAFIFPDFMEVFPWKASQKTKANPTDN